MVQATLRPSSRAGKKFEVEMDGKTIHFGAKGYSDYTRHGDEARKERYLKRHSEPSIEQSARKVRERFGVDLRVQKRAAQISRWEQTTPPR